MLTLKRTGRTKWTSVQRQTPGKRKKTAQKTSHTKRRRHNEEEVDSDDSWCMDERPRKKKGNHQKQRKKFSRIDSSSDSDWLSEYLSDSDTDVATSRKPIVKPVAYKLSDEDFRTNYAFLLNDDKLLVDPVVRLVAVEMEGPVYIVKDKGKETVKVKSEPEDPFSAVVQPFTDMVTEQNDRLLGNSGVVGESLGKSREESIFEANIIPFTKTPEYPVTGPCSSAVIGAPVQITPAKTEDRNRSTLMEAPLQTTPVQAGDRNVFTAIVEPEEGHRIDLSPDQTDDGNVISAIIEPVENLQDLPQNLLEMLQGKIDTYGVFTEEKETDKSENVLKQSEANIDEREPAIKMETVETQDNTEALKQREANINEREPVIKIETVETQANTEIKVKLTLDATEPVGDTKRSTRSKTKETEVSRTSKSAVKRNTAQPKGASRRRHKWSDEELRIYHSHLWSDPLLVRLPVVQIERVGVI